MCAIIISEEKNHQGESYYLVELGEAHTKDLPESGLARAARTDDNHASTLAQLLIQLQGLLDLNSWGN